MHKKIKKIRNLVILACQILILSTLFFAQDSFRAQPLPPSSYVTLTPDSKILFGLSQGGSSALLEGWSGIEEWGVWSEKPVARMALDLQSQDLGAQTVRISVNYFYVGYSGGFKYSIFVNEKKYSDNIVSTISDDDSILIDLKSIAKGNNLSALIRFEFKALTSPKDLGVSEDSRLLGIGLKSVELIPTQKSD
jgi:hypothetical protein